MLEFPDDENGAALRGMAERGIDLVSPRMIDFEHCFADEVGARRFLAAVRGTVQEATLFPPDSENGSGWEVQCRERLVPTHAAITETERRLADVAMQFGGYADGWGSLSNPDGSPALTRSFRQAWPAESTSSGRVGVDRCHRHEDECSSE